jgi:hypothetical protein
MAAPTWNNPIKTYFTPTDVQHMLDIAGFDLSSYSDVRDNAPGAGNIYDMVSSGKMPPNSPWPTEWVTNFKAWMDAGYPEN